MDSESHDQSGVQASIPDNTNLLGQTRKMNLGADFFEKAAQVSPIPTDWDEDLEENKELVHKFKNVKLNELAK